MILAPPPEPCYDFVPVQVSAAMQSKRKLPSLIARAPKPATPKPRLMRIVVPCPNIPEPIEPTTFELLPVLPPPETFAAPEPAAPVVAAAAVEPEPCDCFMPVGGYIWAGGGAGNGGSGGFYLVQPAAPNVTPIPEPPVWALLLSALGVAAIRRKA